MNTYKLKISSPDGHLFDGEAVQMIVRGADGELAILAGHIPFITSVQPCTCIIELEAGSKKDGATQGGLLCVSKEEVTLLSSSFEWKQY